MKCIYCLNCPKLGQLIIRRIIRIVATRCTKFDFGWGSAPDPTWEAYSAALLVELTVLPDPLAASRGPYF